MLRHEVMTQSTQAVRNDALSGKAWDSIKEPGVYVDRDSGDLYRFPKEAFLAEAGLAISKESCGDSALVKVSSDPFLSTFRARLLAAQHNIKPNF
jgi:hypothetical protein